MLLKLSDQISECLAQAAEARERADATTDPELREDWLQMELRWLRIVESCRFVEQAALFLEDSHAARTSLIEILPRTGVLVVSCPTTGKDFSTGIMTDEASLKLLSQELNRSRCPHCGVEHSWWTRDAKLVDALPQKDWVEFAHAEVVGIDPGYSEKGTPRVTVNSASLGTLLDVLVRTAIEQAQGKARAAFYIADASGTGLHHVVGMPEAYARRVDGFAIGPKSLACGLAASIRLPVITPDVTEEPRWKPWLSLANEFGYRACWSFPVETPAGKVVGTFAMYYKEPREATQRDLDNAAALTRTAGAIISRH